jgi:prevent-host-death family protein
MRQASVTEAKNRLSALLDEVRAGETIVIVDRGIPVARLEPAARSDDAEGRLARLNRAGFVVLPSATDVGDALNAEPPKPRRGASALAALLDERASGR